MQEDSEKKRLGHNSLNPITKILKVENKVTGLQKELSETKEVKSHLEHEKVEQEQELCNLRFTLKQEQEKRKNTDWLYEKIEEQLREKQEQYNKEVEVKQQLKISLRTLDMELNTVRKNLNQVLEERNDIQRQLSQKENVRILQDGILCKQKEIEMTQEKMSSELQEAQDQHTEAVRCAEKMKDRLQKCNLKQNSKKLELELKNSKLKVIIKKQAEKNEQLQKNLFSANLTQAESQHLQQIRENNSASIKGQMELRIKHLESELFKMKTQEESNRKQLGIYQEICLEGFQITKSLSDELNKTNEKLKEVNTKLLIEKHYNRSLQHSTLSTRPISECHCTGNHDCFVFDRSFTPRRNLVTPTSNPWPSNESMQNPRVWQELQENITREVTEAAAELESRSFRVSPLGCTNK
ncbi:ankyrin repeat domain-containing protein 26-like [Marmota marmota marmota]|uniref:ankyrin repeat domain-containing protein 26-like n=1 Tax=Marmota marmota marmota TaxID=9994 RepID=UPI0020928552|nr:ankyrin repeat domain-containing protein 26-like [Marmota marmota marmota]